MPRLGSPGLPDQPFAEARERRNENGGRRHAATMSMQEALAKLRAHLKAHPDDLTGWLLLARSEVGLGRYRGGRRGLSPRRRAVRRIGPTSPAIGARRRSWPRRHGHAGGARGVRGRAAGQGERAAIALLPGAREVGAGRPEAAHCRTGSISPPTRRPTPNGSRCCASASPKSQGGGHRPGIGHAVRRGGRTGRHGAARPAAPGMPSPARPSRPPRRRRQAPRPRSAAR